MCEDYKSFDISIIDRKCDTTEVNCPYFDSYWEDYEFTDENGDINWDSDEICYCNLQNLADENTKCPLFGFSKNNEVKVTYSYG